MRVVRGAGDEDDDNKGSAASQAEEEGGTREEVEQGGGNRESGSSDGADDDSVDGSSNGFFTDSSESSSCDEPVPWAPGTMGGLDSEPVQRYCGHVSMNTVKDVSFLGQRSEFVASGSDCGRIFVWCTRTGRIVRTLHGDLACTNVIQQHPTTALIASCGSEASIKLWSPTGPTASVRGRAQIFARHARVVGHNLTDNPMAESHTRLHRACSNVMEVSASEPYPEDYTESESSGPGDRLRNRRGSC